MKKILLINLFLYLFILVLAQPNITKVEYYIDTDPGYGLATDIPFTSTNDIDINFNPDISALSNGIHTFFVRAKDVNGKWTHTRSHSFYKGFGATNQPISIIEYYFDTDPGYGKANALNFNPALEVEVTVSLDVSSLPIGIHQLFIRAKDIEGQWTTTKSHTFYKGLFSNGTAATISSVEYYIDTDPGFGNGSKVAFTAGKDLDLTFDVALTGLSNTAHTLFIRTQDENGSWSFVYARTFCLTPDKPSVLSGNIAICKATKNSQYSVTPLTSATSYVWTIVPTNAGIITGTGTTVTVDYGNNFTGEVQISTAGKNDCGTGPVSDILNVNVTDCSGIEENEIPNLQIYPNPTMGNFYLKLESLSNKTNVEILNINGQVIFTKSYSTYNISDNISLKQVKGVYLVKIFTEKQLFIKKLIIE